MPGPMSAPNGNRHLTMFPRHEGPIPKTGKTEKVRARKPREVKKSSK